MSESPPPLDAPMLTGQLFLARLEYLREHHPSGGIHAVLGELSEEDRQRLQGVARDVWCPFEALMCLDRAIAALLGGNASEIYERLGEASARHRTEWLGENARLVSVHAFLSRVADEHRRFHSFGRASYRRMDFAHGEISVSEYPEFDEVFCRSSVGYFRGAVAYLTGGPVDVEERECQCRGTPACVFCGALGHSTLEAWPVGAEPLPPSP